MLEEEKILEFKTKLEDELRELDKEIKDLDKMPEFGTETAEIQDEEADEAEEWTTNVSIESTLKVRRADILDALKKIDENKYGSCEKCANEIEQEILNINPESRLCKNCKLSTR